MKKFSAVALAIFTLFAGVVMSACEEKIELSLSKQYLEMFIGDEVDIKPLVNLEGKAEVVISSLDNDIVVVKDGVATAQSAGVTIILAKAGNKTANMEVKVVGSAISADAPQGLRFDETQNAVVWDSQIINLDGVVETIKSYDVLISHNGQESTKTIVGDNKLELVESGEYIIKVKSNGRSDDEKIVYNSSQYSEALSLTKLPKPYDIEFADGVLKFKADELCKNFRVKVNGVLSDVITEKQMELSLSNIDPQTQQTFEISVVAVAEQNADKTYVSSESDSITRTRLFAPEMSINAGVITWDNSQQGDFHYEISRQAEGGISYSEVVSGGEYTLEGLPAGEYNTITLKAIADSEEYLDSENISSLEKITKLEKTTLAFDLETKTISASNFEGKKIELQIKHKNQTEKVDLINGQYLWQKADSGLYEIVAYVYAQTAKEINSDISNKIQITQLAKLSGSEFSQRLDENNNYILEFEDIEGANTYDFRVVKADGVNAGVSAGLIDQGDKNFGNADTIFSEAGAYKVYVTASYAGKLENNQFVLPSVSDLDVFRHSDMTIGQQADANGKVVAINWDSVSNVSGYMYVIEKDGQEFDDGTITGNSFSTTNFSFGRYTFKLKAIGLSGTQVLYLDSLTFAETSFEVEYELEKPTIVYDRELNAVIITKVEYATSYEIKMNNTDIPHDNSQENITISMEDKLNEAGIYTITVIAQNADNELILDSDISQINIKKHDAPKTFMLLADGTLTIQDYPNTIGLDADKETILINNVETAKLDDEEYFEVKAKFNAKQINVGNTYYIDSDYSTFVIERVDSSQKPALVGENITWTEFTQTGFSYVLHIEQEGLKTKIELTTASISVYDNRLAGINLNKDFSVAVEYKFSGAQINLPLEQSQKFSSKISEATTIQKIVNDVNMVATEANGEVTISWNACAIEDVVYNLYIGEEKAYTGNATSFVATQYFANEGVYSAKIEISKQGYITSDKNEITIERLKAVTNLNISAEENVEAVTNYNVSYTLEGSNGNYNLSKDVQVEKVLIKKGNEEITSLAQFDGIFTIDVSLVAKQNTSGTKFYLSSKTSAFEFNRAKTLNAPTVANSQILWETLEGIASYRLKFEADAISKSLDVTGQSISCDDTAIQNIISSFESREFDVSVMAVISAFVANSGESHLLSSRFSNAAELIKLNDVENITVVSTNDNFQKNITISWQHTQDASLVGGYVVEVMKGTTSIAVQTVGPNATSLTIEDGFKDAGEYSVNIVAIGQNNAINSDKITSDIYTRLFAPKNISITNEALITWTGVVGATKYVVDVYYNDTIKQTYQDITNTQLDISELMFSNNFAGDVNIKVLAVGGNGQDEAKTFSSDYSDVVVANKKATAILEFATNSVKITGDFENTSSLSFKLVVSADNRVVKTVDLKYGQTYVFENWTYADDGTKVPTNVQKVYTFAIQTFSSEANSLKSDIATQNVTKLKDVQNLGFVRDGEIDSNLYFVGDAVDNAHSYVLSVGAYKTSAFNLYNSQISLIVANDFEKALAQQFEITIYAQGEIGGNINYINSSTTTIKGQKLPTVTGFGVANGQLVWNKTEGATDYNLRISETNVKSGYVTDNNHTLFDTLFGLVGTQNVNIRAIGNVGTTPRSEDVILDSSYIRNAQSFELENLEVYKLAKVDSVEVVDGYITISFVDEAESYDIVVGENAYELKLFESVSETTNKMTSSALYSALTVNVGYQGQIIAKSTQSNVIYSDKTDAINIKILDNVTKNTLTIGFKPKGDGSYDYSIATASWFGDDTVALNGYKIDFSGDVLTVADTSYVLDPLGELVGGGVYTISVCVAGGSGVQTDGYCHLNSNYGEKVSFTKLQSPTPYLENGLLSWTAVNGANGYLVYLDGLQQNPSIVNTTNFVLDKANLSSN
ncbi:MAG: hypothetical protein IJA69_02755, partial [Clostridia bacterium]|nr:hypothetical protein [Clostridia bacterium]